MRAWQRRNMVITSAVAVVLLAFGLFAAVSAGSGSVGIATVPATITINSQIGITFAPAAQDAAPNLTALQAFKRYERVGEVKQVPSIPSNLTVKLGLLTVPVGPADAPGAGNLTKRNGIAYTALNELAYGYSWHRCPSPVIGLPGSTDSPSPAASNGANPCVEWNFVDATTGKQIIEIFQM